MTIFNILLYIVAKIINAIAIIYMVNSLYDYIFKEDKNHEDNNFRSK